MKTRIVNKILSYLILCSVGLLGLQINCGHIQTPGIVNEAVDCAQADVVSKIPSLIDSVATCLLAPDKGTRWTCLGRMAVDSFTDTAVICGVKIAGEESAQRAASNPNQPNANRIKVNADEYLSVRGVTWK